MKKVITVLLILILFDQANAQVTQEWAARYNGPGNSSDQAYSVAVDGSGNVYTTGYSVGVGTGSYDYCTIKYNSSGVQQWVSRYNGTANGTDYAYAIAVDDSGNVYVTGGSVGIETNYYDYVTIKYDVSGVQQWVRGYDLGGGDIASLIEVDGSGNIYVSGYSLGSGTGDDYCTIKYNSSGNQLWVARFNGVFPTGYERPYALALDEAGNVYVTGESSDSALHADYVTVKYNSSGVQQWVSRYNGPGNSYDYAFSIAIAPSGNVCVTGSSTGVGTNADYATVQYSPTGVQQWVSRYNFLPLNVPDEAYSIAVDGSNNVYVTGYSSKTFGNYDYATIKYNSSGDSLWVKRYNGSLSGHDKARDLALDGSANVYVTGYSREFTGGDNYTTIRYNSSGVQQWLASYTGSILNNGEDARSIALDGPGNVYVAGYSSTDTTLWDYATVKYSQTGFALTLNLTAFIEGFYNSVSNNMISDTARVYLKNISSPYNTVDSSIKILSSSGAGTFLFSNAVNGINYYLVAKHRNSIETWSSSGNAFTSGTMTYNFSTNSSQAYGNNMKQVDASPVRFAIYSGDYNQDGVVDATDAGAIDNDAYNFATGYINTDITGDASVDASDAAIADNNASNFVGKITP